MRHRLIVGGWTAIGIAALLCAVVPTVLCAAEAAATNDNEKSIEEQRKEMAEIMERMNADAARQPAVAPSPPPASPEVPAAASPAHRTRPPRPVGEHRPPMGHELSPTGPTTRPNLSGLKKRSPSTRPATLMPPTSPGAAAPPIPAPPPEPTAVERSRNGSADRPGAASRPATAMPPRSIPSSPPAAPVVTEVHRPSEPKVNPQEAVVSELLTPATKPAAEELLTGKSADGLPEISDKELNELKERLKKAPTANVPPPPDDVGKEKDRWKIPPEKRTYFFTWQDTPLAQCIEDFGRMTGLTPIGAEVLQGGKNITYRSAEVMTFDRAMDEFNLILSQQQFWAVRQEKHLVVKKLTDWHRNIPQDRYYPSVEAYRAAKVPSWEVVGVVYECKQASPAKLVEYMLDRLPDNTIRAGTVSGSNQVALTGPAYFVDQALKHADDFEKAQGQDPRTIAIYTVENIKPSVAATMIRELGDFGPATGGPRPSIARPPGAPPAAPVGESPFDQVSIQAQDDSDKVIVRAMPEQHKKIKEILAQIDVKPKEDEREIKEIVLKNIRPDDAINLIRPLVTESAAVATPPPPPQPIPNEPPQQFQQRQQQWQAQMAAFHRGRSAPGGDGPQLFADSNRNVLIVRAVKKDFDKIKDLAERFDVAPSPEGAKIIKIRYLDANQTAGVIQQVIGSMGSRGGAAGRQPFMVTADPSGASLILSGDRTDISRAEALIAQLDVEQSDGAKDYVVKLKNAEPTALSQILQQKFASGGGSSFGYHGRHFGSGAASGLPRFIPDDVSKNLLVIATERQWPDIDNLIKQFDVESEVAPRSEVYKLAYASADDVVRMLQQAVIGRGAGRRSMTGGQPQFSADARTNSILAVATDEYHKIAKEMIAKIDQPGYDELKEIPLEKADAEFVAEQLRELLGVAESGRYGMRGGEPQVRILAEPMSNRVLVAATPEKFEQAKKYAAEIDANYAKAGYEERIFTLQHAEAREVVSVLESLYGSGEARPRYYYGSGGGNKTGGIKIMEAQGAVIVRAPKARLDRIAELIQTLEGNAGGANEIRSWHLPGADVRAIAQTIETMFQGRRRFSGGTGVDCTADEASNMLFVSAPADQMAKIAEHIETIKTNSPKETVFAVKYFPVVNARAEDIAAAIEPVIEAKWQADASRRTGRSRWDSYANRPQVSGDPNTKRVMVAGPEDLMPLVEQLVREMDVAPEGGAQVVRFVQLKKGKAEDLAPVVEDAVRKSGGSGYRPRRSYWRMMYGGYSPGGGSSESGEVTVTAIPSSNSLLLRGPEQKVEEAVKLALQIDGEARPDGPMIKTYVLKYADVFDVQDTIEGLLGGTSVGGFSDYGGDYGGSMFTSGRGSSRSRRRGGGQIVVTTDYANNTLLVAADYEKLAQVDSLIELKEAMAEAQKKREETGEGGDTVVTRDGIMKTYEVGKADAEDVADQLEKMLEDRYGFWDAPTVRAMKYTNSVVVTAKPEQLKVAEGYLNTVVKNWTPKTVIVVKQVESGVPPSRLASFLATYAGAETPPNVKPLQPTRPEDDPEWILRHKREIQFNTPITTQPAGTSVSSASVVNVSASSAANTTGTSANPFVPTGELARLRAELASLSIAQVTTTRPTAAAQPAVVGAGSATAAPTTKPAAPSAAGRVREWTPVALKHMPAGEAAAIVREAVDRLLKQAGATGPSPIEVQVDPRGNGLLVSAPPKDLEQLRRLISLLDQPAATQPSAATRPAGAPAPAVAAAVPPTTTRPVGAPASQPAVKPPLAAAPASGAPRAASSPSERVAGSPVVSAPPAATGTQAKPTAVAEPPAPVAARPVGGTTASPAGPAGASSTVPPLPVESDVMNKVVDAASDLSQTGRPQIMFDDRTGMMLIVGRPKQVEELQDLMKSLEEQLSSLPVTTDIRVFRLEYVDVNVAATILETMFNESGSTRNRPGMPGQPGVPGQPQQPGQPPQPGQPQGAPQQQARGREAGRGDERGGRGSEETGGRRGERGRERAGDRTGTEEKAGPRPLLRGDRIRVFPDIRTRTLVIRAHPDDYRAIAELLLKIDRPSENPGIDIRIFQLKKLNAAEVEQALKAILKIDQRDRRRMPRMMTGGAVPGMPGSWMGQTALIEQLQEQMLELQTAGEGKLAINPSEQITITSDATTNSVIVSAPDDGMKLVEKLINKLEEQEIPLMVKTIKLENADVGDIMPQLEKLFERGGGGGGGGRPGAGGENVTPSRLGAVSIAADARTNQLIIRALAPDFEKILPVIQNLDQKLDGQVVQTFTLQHADAASIEQALSKTYISTTGGKGTGSPIRMAADTSTNTLFVWADASKRAEIAAQVMELDKKAQEKGETKKIALTQANAQVVAEKLNAAFGTRTGRGRSEVKITGDSASGVLFVTAPPEIFKQIEEAAKAMDTQKLLQIKSFTLKNAYATEVLEQMKDMTMQLSGQLRGRTDMQLDVFAATADARTNTIFVTGAAATIAIAETVIKQIDVAPSTPTAQITQYFTLTKADAASVAQTINNLYVNVPGKAVPPPKAYAEPVTNSVFVYATQPQIDQIKATVIDPLEKAAPEAGQDIQMYRIALKYAKADDVLQTMTQYVNQRRAALAQAGVQRNMRPQDLAISLTADTNTNQLILSCNKKNYEEIKALIDTIDVEQTSAMARQTKIYPLRYADVSSASQAINQALSKPGTVGEKDRVTVVPEYGTQSVVVTASPENLAKADKIVEDLDKDSITKYERHIVELKAAQADDVATALTQAYAQRRSTRQGDRPVTVVAEPNTNKLVVSCTQTEFPGVKELIDALDVPKSEEADRQIKTFRLQYTEVGYLVPAIQQAFQSRTGRQNPRDIVTAAADYTTGTLIVAASKDRMKQVEALVAEMDREVEGASTPQFIPLKVANAAQLAMTLKQVFTDPAQQRRGRIAPESIPVIIGDERSNSVIVRAKPADYNLIKQMIANMDTEAMQGAGGIRVIPVAEGIDVETLAAQIEKTMNEGQQFLAQQTGGKPMRISVGADRRTNALMVSGAPALFPEVEKLVAQLEKMKPPGGTGVLIVPLRNVRPDDVKRVIDQMQQKRSGYRSSADWKDSEIGRMLRHSA